MQERKVKARFIEPMLLLRPETLQEGSDWLYELKFDGYRGEHEELWGGGLPVQSSLAPINAGNLS